MTDEKGPLRYVQTMRHPRTSCAQNATRSAHEITLTGPRFSDKALTKAGPPTVDYDVAGTAILAGGGAAGDEGAAALPG